MSAKRYSLTCANDGDSDFFEEENPAGPWVNAADYLAACRDAVAMAREVLEMRLEQLMILYPSATPSELVSIKRRDRIIQAAQRVIAAYGEEGT